MSNIMNPYFQHILYYRSKIKDLNINSDDCDMQHYNHLPKTGQKLLLVIIDGWT